MKDQIYKLMPNFFQGLMISLFNFLAYRKRYGKEYRKYRDLFRENRNLSLENLKNLQKSRFNVFLQQTIKSSAFFISL